MSLTSLAYPRTSINRAAGCCCAFCDSGLKAYYKFNVGFGNLVNKSQSVDKLASVDGTAINCPTYSQLGVVGCSISLTDDGFHLGATDADWDFLHDTTTDVTIAWWMKLNATDEGGGSDRIIGNSNLAAGSRGLLMYMDDTGGQDHDLRAEIVGASLEQDVILTTNSYVPKETTCFHFYVFTLDKSTGRGDFYRDNANNFNNTPTHTYCNCCSAVLDMDIGKSANSINAEIDEVSIWSRILTSCERTDLYNGGCGLAIYPVASPCFTDNFGGADNWCDTGTNVAVNICTNVLDFCVPCCAGSDDATSYDLAPDICGCTISDSAWTLRFKQSITTYSDNTDGTSQELWFGISDMCHATAIDGTQDGIGMLISNNVGEDNFGLSDSDAAALRTIDTVIGSKPASCDVFFWQISRTSTTAYFIKQYSDSAYMCLVTSQTGTTVSTNSGLRYVKGVSFVSDGTANGTILGTIDDVEFWCGDVIE